MEVKNCHLRREGTLAEFPDCVAARSARHLRELAAEVRRGARAVQLFVIQRTDCDRFSACADLDPTYAAGLTAAASAGVEAFVLSLRHKPYRDPHHGAPSVDPRLETPPWPSPKT